MIPGVVAPLAPDRQRCRAAQVDGSRSSKMYCCSFFQLSSRRARTSRMKASRSVSACGSGTPGAEREPGADARATGWSDRSAHGAGMKRVIGLTLSDVATSSSGFGGSAPAGRLMCHSQEGADDCSLRRSRSGGRSSRRPTCRLTTSHLVVGPNSRVTLTNTASQPVTAWALATVTQRPAAGRTGKWKSPTAT